MPCVELVVQLLGINTFRLTDGNNLSARLALPPFVQFVDLCAAFHYL